MVQMLGLSGKDFKIMNRLKDIVGENMDTA